MSKTSHKRLLKKDQKMAFKTDYRLMQVKSIAECSFSKLPWLRPLFCLSYSGRFRQVLQYPIFKAAWVNLEKSWMTAILFLHSQENIFLNIMCANIKVLNLLARCHYTMNLSCTPLHKPNHEKKSVAGAQQRYRSAWDFSMSIHTWLKHRCLPHHILVAGCS